MSVRQGNKVIAGGNSITVDQVLDINSPNPIANSAVTAGLNGKEPTITLTASRAVVTDANGKVAASTVTSTELGYVHGVTSAIQTQLNSKEATITGAATTITGNNLTASRALVSDSTGKVAASTVTSTELGYLHGATSSVQTQINNKADTATTYTKTEVDTIASGKANVALDNLTNAGKEVCAHQAMPSDRYIDLTVAATGSTYVAPADGYVRFSGRSTSQYGNIGMIGRSSNADLVYFTNYCQYPNNYMHITIPVSKGQTVKIVYFDADTLTLRFIYANGAQ